MTEAVRQAWKAWRVPIGISAAIVAWGLLIYAAVGNRPRNWAYGVLPYVPGESYYSSQRPARRLPPKQVDLAPVIPGGQR